MQRKGALIWVVLPLIFSLFMLGYSREAFFAFVERLFYQFISSNPPHSTEKYPVTLDGILFAVTKSPKWLASVLYSYLFALHAVAIIACIYRSKKLVFLTLGIYMSLSFTCFLLILLGAVFHNYPVGYGLAQHLKLFIQSPLLVALVVATLRLFFKSTNI